VAYWPHLLPILSGQSCVNPLSSSVLICAGPDPKADLVIEKRNVLRRHLYLQVLGRGLFYVDFSVAPAASGWLPLGGSLAVGPYRIRLPGGGLIDD